MWRRYYTAILIWLLTNTRSEKNFWISHCKETSFLLTKRKCNFDATWHWVIPFCNCKIIHLLSKSNNSMTPRIWCTVKWLGHCFPWVILAISKIADWSIFIKALLAGGGKEYPSTFSIERLDPPTNKEAFWVYTKLYLVVKLPF